MVSAESSQRCGTFSRIMICARAGRATDRAPSASPPAFSTSRRVREVGTECWRSSGMGAPPLVVRCRWSGRESTTNPGSIPAILDVLTCQPLDVKVRNGATSVGRSRARGGGRHGENGDGADNGGHEGGGDGGAASGDLRRSVGG